MTEKETSKQVVESIRSEGKSAITILKEVILSRRSGTMEQIFQIACCLLRGIEIDGERIEIDEMRAAIFFRMAVKVDKSNYIEVRNYAEAQNNYGWCFQHGIGVVGNVAKAVKYYKLAADQGLAQAQNNYGWCLQNGTEVAKNLPEAARYYKMAADHGNTDAQRAYARCLKRGVGVEKNKVEAARYLEMAESSRPPSLTEESCILL
jgi:TPR repeat protein